jgi:hypothetical protein
MRRKPNSALYTLHAVAKPGRGRADAPALHSTDANTPTSEHNYSIEDLITALLRDQGIHEGHWALNIEFSATGAAVKPQD